MGDEYDGVHKGEPPPPRPSGKDMAGKVAKFTGLSAAFVEESEPAGELRASGKELLRDKRLMVGRLDGRVHRPRDRDAAGENQEFDPSNTALQGPTAPSSRLREPKRTKWRASFPIPPSANVRPWQYEEGRYLNLVDNLRTGDGANPYLHVMVVNGYYDMATPFAGTEATFDHVGYEKTYADRISPSPTTRATTRDTLPEYAEGRPWRHRDLR